MRPEDVLKLRVAVKDKAALNALDCAQVETYLRNQGWTEHHKLIRDGIACSVLLVHPPTTMDVQVPQHNNFSDHALLMERVLRTLEEVEDRSQLAIYLDLLSTEPEENASTTTR